MTKHVIIGDIHGRSDFWKTAVVDQDLNKDIYYVFVGDYFDSFDITGDRQIINFKQICKLKEIYPDNFILLHGNHDFLQYHPHHQMCSGYQYSSADCISEALKANEHLFSTAYCFDNYLVTHAGVSQAWLEDNEIQDGSIVENINELWKTNPKAFFFYQKDRGGYGNHPLQSPLWLRPEALKDVLPEGFTQIVGHSQKPGIEFDHGTYLVDTGGREYLVIGEDGPEIFKLN